MGRRPIGKVAMTGAERIRPWRRRQNKIPVASARGRIAELEARIAELEARDREEGMKKRTSVTKGTSVFAMAELIPVDTLRTLTERSTEDLRKIHDALALVRATFDDADTPTLPVATSDQLFALQAAVGTILRERSQND